jgi:hypothetical protein
MYEDTNRTVGVVKDTFFAQTEMRGVQLRRKIYSIKNKETVV